MMSDGIRMRSNRRKQNHGSGGKNGEGKDCRENGRKKEGKTMLGVG